MNRKILCIAAMLPLAACQRESATDVNGQGGKSPAPSSIKDYRGVDPASIHPHLADSVSASVDSVRLLAEEAGPVRVEASQAPREKKASSGWVRFCTATNQLGTCKTVYEGLDYNDLRFQTAWGNDAISSMTISPGASLYLCDANNWGGPCYFINKSVDDFRQFPHSGTTFNFNDKVTSFKWQQDSDGSFLRVWDYPYLEGPYCDMVAPFDYNYPPCNFNDRTSSYAVYSNGYQRFGGFSTGASWTLNWLYTDPVAPSANVMPAGWENVVSSWEWLN